MSTVSGDYNNYASGGAGCHYADLSNYTSDYSLGVPVQGKIVTGKYIVPQWAGISYDSLTSKVGSCSGYSDINNAYGKDAGNCQTTYRTSLCGGGGGAPPMANSCGSLAPAQRTACCAGKQMNKSCDMGCENAKQFCQ